MFVIQDIQSGYYFHSKGKIILFESSELASAFLNEFMNYAIQRRVAETENPMAIMEVQSKLMSIQIIEQNFEEIPPCGVINFRELN